MSLPTLTAARIHKSQRNSNYALNGEESFLFFETFPNEIDQNDHDILDRTDVGLRAGSFFSVFDPVVTCNLFLKSKSQRF